MASRWSATQLSKLQAPVQAASTSAAIHSGVVASGRVKHLIEAIEAYIVEHNSEPKAFRWTATANSIFEKITASLE